MKTHILDQEAPGLTAHLSVLTHDTQLRLIAKAALLVSAALPDTDQESEAILKLLRTSETLSAADVKSAMELSEVADNRYFEAQTGRASQKEQDNGSLKLSCFVE